MSSANLTDPRDMRNGVDIGVRRTISTNHRPPLTMTSKVKPATLRVRERRGGLLDISHIAQGPKAAMIREDMNERRFYA